MIYLYDGKKKGKKTTKMVIYTNGLKNISMEIKPKLKRGRGVPVFSKKYN